MASYNVRLYLNSGFNSINIPDNPSTLEASATVVTTDALVILQDKFLRQVDIKATWDTVERCDYVKIGSFYYSVQGVQMLSVETARLFITPDFITSAGGFTKSGSAVITDFDILDGITERQTVDDDTFGAYADADPLTAPQKPLEISTEWKTAGTGDGQTFLSTLLDLAQLAAHSEGQTYTDTETGEQVTVPRVYQADPNTYAKVIIEGNTHGTGQRWYQMTAGNTGLATQLKGIAQARALGVEGAILDQWKIPAGLVGAIVASDTAVETEYVDRQIQISSVSGTITGTISANYGSPKNNRLLYGEYNRYGIMTCAGNSIEAKPEEIMSSAGTPSITFKTDPRPDGKPYYRFTTMNNDSEFFRNCVAGSPWEKVPLVYQSASGNALTRLNYQNSRASQELARRQTNDTYAWNQIQNIGDTMANALGAAADTNSILPGSGMLAAAGEVIKGANNAVSMGIANTQYNETYARDKANELSQLYQDTTIYTPSVNFPYNADFLRDAKNNGILIYKYSYNSADMSRIDTLLTMYGYKESEALTAMNFFRREKFDYVQCSSISIGGLPRWWNDGIADQLRNGVRVWHTKPSSTAYSSNPIRS